MEVKTINPDSLIEIDKQPPDFTEFDTLGIGSVVMMEHPAENYFCHNSHLIKHLIDHGYSGIYISFQRPFTNVSSRLRSEGIDIDKLKFIDVAAVFSGEHQAQDDHCININEHIEIDDLVRAIYTSLPSLPSEKRFIFIDSLTTIALYKPLSETMRFSEFLVHTVRNKEQPVTLIFNVVHDLAQKRFIRDVAFRVDHVIRID